MNEKVIWDFLMWKIKNAYGTAAVMGNLMAESSLNPLCVTGNTRCQKSNYVLYVDCGKLDFADDGVAFGLAQWRYKTRKADLYEYACGKSVGDLQVQLEFLVKEMSERYKSVWKAVTEATDVRTASDVVMLKYEKPGNQTEAAKQKRANYGEKFFQQFAPAESTKALTGGKKMVIARDNVNLRAGRGTSTPKVGEVKKGTELEWIATENGWHKVAVWVSGSFTEVRK
jgi:hypothetical protein